jgi:hypothetical protein
LAQEYLVKHTTTQAKAHEDLQARIKELEESSAKQLVEKAEAEKVRLEGDMAQKLQSEGARLVAEYEQQLAATQAKLAEEVRNQVKELDAMSWKEISEKVGAEKARLGTESTQKVHAEVTRLGQEHLQKQMALSAKFDEDLRNRAAELEAASEKVVSQRIETEKSRLLGEWTQRVQAEELRLAKEHDRKLRDAEEALKAKTAHTLEIEKKNIEETVRKGLLSRGRYSHLTKVLQKPLYPFAAMIGMEKAKRALILNAINPSVGGVVLWGHEGCGKTSLLLSFAEMVAPITENIADSATEHRDWNDEARYVTGQIHFEKEKAVYLIDTVLHGATLSLSHPQKHAEAGASELPSLLLNSLREEDDHAYHLLSGYTLRVEVASSHTVEARVDVMNRNAEYRRDPRAFREKHRMGGEEVLGRIRSARERFPTVNIPPKMRGMVAQMTTLDKLSSRLDIHIEQLARANAAYEGRAEVALSDVIEAAELVLINKFTPHKVAEAEKQGLPHEIPPARPKGPGPSPPGGS